MNPSTGLWEEEQVIFSLRDLYERYGYVPYKMNKFEEYDLYVRNKDFLISDSIITFTDTNGRLMALKPDVTLSIVKNSGDISGRVQKVYYDENVYRVAKGSHTFREIRQVGLECLGELDRYCLSEVLLLAAESLRSISPEVVLDVSHLGLITGVLDRCGVPELARASILKHLGEKNRHELASACRAAGMVEDDVALLCELIGLYGRPEVVLPRLREVFTGTPEAILLEQLAGLLEALEGSEAAACVRLDLSVVGDIRYYTGIVFKGFVSGVPGAVLSGGQYDRLLHKMGKLAGAMGFAVYLGMLDSLCMSGLGRDADEVLLYDDKASLAAVIGAVHELQTQGQRVLALRRLPEKLACRRVWRLTERGVELLEYRT